jgi:hypothetical protein
MLMLRPVATPTVKIKMIKVQLSAVVAGLFQSLLTHSGVVARPPFRQNAAPACRALWSQQREAHFAEIADAIKMAA